MKESNVLCSICYNNLVNPLTTLCNYQFYKTYLHEWLHLLQQRYNKIECPLCRCNLEDLMNKTWNIKSFLANSSENLEGQLAEIRKVNNTRYINL